MSLPRWRKNLDDDGIHRGIFDKTLANAEPYNGKSKILGYHEKHVKESNGKLLHTGADKKLRRTALGEGLFKDQKRVTASVLKFNGARKMKKTAGTKARILDDNIKRIMYAIGDCPSPQNINPIRRKVTSAQLNLDKNGPTNSSGKTIIDVPAHVVVHCDEKTILFAIEDCKELDGNNNKNEQTLPFVTHGVIVLACDAQERSLLKIGDRVFAETQRQKQDFKTNKLQQINITGRDEEGAKFIGYYLGPAASRPNGGIVLKISRMFHIRSAFRDESYPETPIYEGSSGSEYQSDSSNSDIEIWDDSDSDNS